MPNTDIRFGATPTDTRDDIRTARMAIEAQTAHGDTEAVQAWTERLNRLMDEAHEQAHRENERRWAEGEVSVVSAEISETVAELVIRVIRHWRLAREAGEWTAEGRRQTQLSSLAARELTEEYGLEVRGSSSGWIIATDY